MADQNQLISSVRIELGDKEQEIWDDDEIIRAIDKAVALMSRLIPKKTSVDVTVAAGNGGGTQRLDITDDLSDFIRIDQLEYPADETPAAYPAFNVLGNTVILTGSDKYTNDEVARIIYFSKWTPATPGANADYPSHLDDAVIIGAAGESLIFQAEKYLHEAADLIDSIVLKLVDLDSVSLTLNSVAAPTPPTFTFPDPPGVLSLTDITAPASPTLSNPTVPTDYSFSKPSAPSLPTAPTAPTAPTLTFTTAVAAMDAIATEITAAKAKLTSGESVINTGTRGENVAANYGTYGSVVMVGAGHRVSEAIARLRQVEDELAKYASQVTSYGSSVNSYANEISGTIGKYREQINAELAGVNNFQAQIAKYQQQLANDALKNDKYNQDVSNYQVQVNEEAMKINDYAQDIANYRAQLEEQNLEAQLFQSKVQSYQIDVAQNQRLIETFSAKVEKIINYATQLNSQVTNYVNISGRCLASGQAKINEFIVALGYKPELPVVQTDYRQPAF